MCLVRILLAFVLTACSLAGFAQTGGDVYVEGRVSNSEGKALLNVTCKLLDKIDSLLAYSFTDKNGEYRIKRCAGAASIMFSRVGYKSETVRLKNGSSGYDATLYDRDLQLNNVTVTADAITRKKDTLMYNVDAFRQKGDVYIEDVLKRMPGIDVDESGRITYQGKAINKLNIEGLDLMGNRYNQATRNMPAEAVAQVQVMENNQPIKARQGKVNNDRATLNLKLKKNYRVKPFGEVSGSIGFDPTLWDNRATAISIAGNNQLLADGAMNNCGIGLGQLAVDMNTLEDAYTYEPEPKSFLYSPTYHVPPMSQRYYLDNKSSFAGLNFLHAFTKSSVLRVNALYYADTTVGEDSVFSRYVADDTVSIFENNRITDSRNTAKMSLAYELNTKKVYLSDRLTGSITWRDAANNNTTNIGKVEEFIYQKPRGLQNILTAELNTPSRLYSLSSVFRLYDNAESLSVVFGGDGSDSRMLKLKSTFMRNRVATVFDLFGNSLTLGYIMEHKHNNVAGTQSGHSSVSGYWIHTAEPMYEINFSGGSAEISLPVEYISCRYSWRDGRTARFMFSPHADASLKIGNLLTADVAVAYNQAADTDNPLTDGVVANNYRTYTKYPDSISVERTSLANLRLSYFDASSMFSCNVYAGWTHVRRDYYMKYLYAGDYTFATPEWHDNSRSSWSLVASLKKIYTRAGLSVDASCSYSYNKALASQNGIEDYLRYNAMNASLTTGWDKLSWINLSVTCAGNVSWKRHDCFSESGDLLKNVYYTVRMDVYPVSNVHAYSDFSQTTFEVSHGHYSTNCFWNAGVIYDVLKSLSLSVSAVNLLDRRVYEEAFYTGVNYQYYRTPLRGREMMVSVRLKF